MIIREELHGVLYTETRNKGLKERKKENIQNLFVTFLKVTISVMPRIPLALHERMQLAQPSNTTTKFQRLHSVINENPDKGTVRHWKAWDSHAFEPLDNHPCAEGDQFRSDPSSEWTRFFRV
jgi:hypothetical protein